MRKARYLTAVLVLVGSVFAAASAQGQGEGNVIAKVSFEPRTYEVYREWAEMRLTSVGKSRHAVSVGETPPEDLKQWCHAFLLQSADPLHNGKRILIVSRGELETGDAQILTARMLTEFRSSRKHDEAEFARVRAQRNREMEEVRTAMLEAESAAERREREARRELRGRSLDELQERARELDDHMFEMDMDIAEAEARREVIVRKLAEAQELAERIPGAHLPEANRTQLLTQLELALGALYRAKANNMADEAAEAEEMVSMLRAEIRELELAEQAHPHVLGLKEHLTDIEVELAGVSARRELLEQQRARIEEILERATSFEEEVDDLRAHREELERGYEELAAWPDGPGDFPLEQPVIEWVGIE